MVFNNSDRNWLSQCYVSLSSCGNLLAVGFKNRLCLLTTQWISAIESNTFILSWSGTLSSEISAILALSICPSQQSSQVRNKHIKKNICIMRLYLKYLTFIAEWTRLVLCYSWMS